MTENPRRVLAAAAARACDALLVSAARGVQRAQQGAARALFDDSLHDFRKGKLARFFLPKKYQQYIIVFWGIPMVFCGISFRGPKCTRRCPCFSGVRRAEDHREMRGGGVENAPDAREGWVLQDSRWVYIPRGALPAPAIAHRSPSDRPRAADKMAEDGDASGEHGEKGKVAKEEADRGGASGDLPSIPRLLVELLGGVQLCCTVRPPRD